MCAIAVGHLPSRPLGLWPGERATAVAQMHCGLVLASLALQGHQCAFNFLATLRARGSTRGRGGWPDHATAHILAGDYRHLPWDAWPVALEHLGSSLYLYTQQIMLLYVASILTSTHRAL